MRDDKKRHKLLPDEAEMVGIKKTDATAVRAFLYNADTFQEIEALDLSFPGREGKLLWLHIDGLNDASLIKNIGQRFGLHPLVVEDILNATQRPKLEDYGTYLFFVIKTFVVKAIEGVNGKNHTEQISFVVGRDFVLSVQEIPGDPFTTVYERLKNARGPVRLMGPDFLGYSLFDTAIDDSLVILHKVQEKIDALEDVMVNRPSAKLLHAVHQLRRNMLTLPRTLRALTDITSTCEHAEFPLISPSTKPYFRDLHDHINSIQDMTEVFRAALSGMLDLYLSSVNNRMNEVMKTLTMISTIFIPLSFLAGVYGMNFKYMPELFWEWGYLVFWVLAAIIMSGMIYMFKKKKWI